MICYLDTSVILRVLFGQGEIWAGWAHWEQAWSSELMGLEARRAIDRLRLDAALDDEGVAQASQALRRIEDGVGLIGITAAVVRRASAPMPTVVKTVDAIHLTSALLFSEEQQLEPVFITHDRPQALAALALGMRVEGVLL